MPSLADIFFTNAKRRKEELNISGAELARKAGYNADHVRSYFRKKSHDRRFFDTSLSFVECIAGALECSPIELLTEKKDDKDQS